MSETDAGTEAAPQVGAGLAGDGVALEKKVIEGAEVRGPGEVPRTGRRNSIVGETKAGQAAKEWGISKVVYVTVTQPAMAKIEKEGAMEGSALTQRQHALMGIYQPQIPNRGERKQLLAALEKLVR